MRYAASVLVGTTVCLALLTSVGMASAQTLGDLARKEGERRKAVTPGKVYTNDSLAKAPAPPPSAAASTPAPPQADAKADPKAGAKTDTASSDTVKKDEVYWRARLQAERDALTRTAVLIEALQGRVNSLQTDFVNRDDPAARAKTAAERQNVLAELERLKLETQQHNKAIVDIQDEARRANVPAAWYR